MLSEEAYLEYQKIFDSVYHKSISFEEAKEQADLLINFFMVIYKIINREDSKINVETDT